MQAETDTAVMINSNGYVKVPDAADLRPSQLTLEAWINPDAKPSTYNTVINKSSDGSWSDGYGLYWNGTSNLRFFVNSYTGAGAIETPVTKGSWSHVVATYDGSTLNLYVNGVLATSKSYSTPITNSLQELSVGEGAGGYYWRGGLDEVAVYGTALTAAQVAQHYSRGTRPVYGSVNIELIKSGEQQPLISVASKRRTMATLSWTIPADIAEGSYVIRVTANEGIHPSDTSDTPFLVANRARTITSTTHRRRATSSRQRSATTRTAASGPISR